MLNEISMLRLEVEKKRFLWTIHVYPYLILAEMYDNDGFVIASRTRSIGSKEGEIEDLRKWCIDNYIIKISSDSIDFRYNTDYFTDFTLDEDWVNTLFKIYARIVQANTELWKDELIRKSQEMNGGEET
jgi:hypothetical protein